MAAELFNTIDGYSVGIPPVPVIDGNGNLITNVFSPNGNVYTGNIYTNNYYYANGDPLVTIAIAGSNTQVQYNNNGQLGASSNFTFNSSNNLLTVSNLLITGTTNLGSVGNINISGGSNGYYLRTDGNGNLSWALAQANSTPGGSNTQIQFNDNGTLGGSNSFTFNKTTETVTANIINATTLIGNLQGVANSALTANTVTNNSQPNITSVGTLANLSVSGNVSVGSGLVVTGTTQSTIFSGSGSGLFAIPAANIIGTVPLASEVTANNQPNITGVGTLTLLNISGPLTSTSTITTTSNIQASNITATNTLLVPTGGSLVGVGNINLTQSPNVALGSNSNVKITGGSAGYFLSTDGNGNLSWVDGGGGGVPSGPNNSIQFNNNGNFGGSSSLTYNDVTKTLNVGGNLVANSIQIGSGVYKFATSVVAFATTTSSASNQSLWEIDAEDIASLDFTVISTDVPGNARQSCKISATVLDGNVVFNEYAGLQINDGVGVFSVIYVPGDILNPAKIRLVVTPDSSNQTKYSIMITYYADW